MFWYLVEADDKTRQTSIRTFPDPQHSEALAALHEAEGGISRMLLEAIGEAPRVCLFRSDSLATLRKTHGSWFLEDVTVDGKDIEHCCCCADHCQKRTGHE